MKKYSSLFWYVALFMLVLLTDRATKFFALFYNFKNYKITKFLRFDILFNRGMSWGMLGSDNSIIFFAVSFFIVLITVAIVFYAYKRFKAGHTIVGEVMAIAGSVSNILDRILHGGVIDFIVIHVGQWSWPVFNVADIFIVLGIFIVFVGIWSKK